MTAFQAGCVGSIPTIRTRIYIKYEVYLMKIINKLHYIHRISNLIGKGLSCHGSKCRFDAGLIRITFYLGKVAIGKARYLLNIVY